MRLLGAVLIASFIASNLPAHAEFERELGPLASAGSSPNKTVGLSSTTSRQAEPSRPWWFKPGQHLPKVVLPALGLQSILPSPVLRWG
jgi:hypothetical protein